MAQQLPPFVCEDTTLHVFGSFSEAMSTAHLSSLANPGDCHHV
jgi:hypothetical protein